MASSQIILEMEGVSFSGSGSNGSLLIIWDAGMGFIEELNQYNVVFLAILLDEKLILHHA
jgi:hypothetical protein